MAAVSERINVTEIGQQAKYKRYREFYLQEQTNIQTNIQSGSDIVWACTKDIRNNNIQKILQWKPVRKENREDLETASSVE